MTSPTSNIGGLASGLDTNSIIAQQMQIERIPLNLSLSRRSLFKTRNDAWATVSTQLAKVRTSARALDDSGDWRKFVSTASSNEQAVTVAASSAASIGSSSFTVERLARAHQVASVSSFTSSTDLVGAGTLSLTIGGTTHDITTDSTTTVAGLAEQIENIAGVRATALKVDSTTTRLVITADVTGDDSTFTVASDQPALGGFSVAAQGEDARLIVGSGPGAITVERSSNTIDDLLAGATITLKATTASPVTVSVSRNIDAAVTAIQTLVSDMNSALAKLNDVTKPAADGSGSGAALSTDTLARSMKLGVRSALSGLVPGATGTFQSASSLGVGLDRNGVVTLDAAKLRTALETDFAGVEAVFARTASATDGRVAVSSANKSSLDGTHAVIVTQAAERAGVTGSAYVAPGADQTFDITVGGITVSPTVVSGASLTDAVAAINASLAAGGVTNLVASESSGSIRLETAGYGTGAGFTVAANPFGLAGTFTGVNVAGTIGGLAATGLGRSLSASGALDGLILSISASSGEVAGAGGNLALGTVGIRSGKVAGLTELLDSYLDTGGAIDRATDRWDAQIKVADARISDLEKRLERKEASLRKYWTSLETAMSRMAALSSQLSAGLASLSQQQR
jgi:flagellar hook-associated protein 2